MSPVDEFKTGSNRGSNTALGGPHSAFERSKTEAERRYTVIKYRKSSGEIDASDYFKVTGDHIYVAEIHGSAAVYLSINRGPWLKIMQGDTITRPFQQIEIRLMDWMNFVRPTEVLMYTSVGKFIDRKPINHGFTAGFKTYDGAIATTTVRGIFDDLYPPVITGGSPSIGRYGGCVIIKNSDPSNTLYVGDTVSGANDGFPLYAGESITLDLSGAIQSLTTQPPANVGQIYGRVWTKAGTCLYSYIVSGMQVDFTMPLNDRPSSIEK